MGGGESKITNVFTTEHYGSLLMEPQVLEDFTYTTTYNI